MTTYVTVTDFYSGSGPYDAAFTAAFAAGSTVRVPAGTYLVTQPIVITSGKALIGDSYADTKIVSSSPTLPVIRIVGGSDFFEISNLRITHEGVTAQLGGDGIQQDGGSTTDRGLLANLYIDYNFNGAQLYQTGRSVLQNVVAANNSEHGFLMVALGTNALQWQYEGCSAALNGANGFLWLSTGSNAGGTSTGTLSNCTTFANGQSGVFALGTAQNPLQGIRIVDGFFGADSGHGICLDTYGGGHVLRPSFVELSGLCGIYIGPSNASTHVAAGVVNGNGQDGILAAGSTTNIVGGIWQANGLAGLSGRQNGIYVYDSQATITGARCRDNGANKQAFGVVASSDTLIVGCNLRGNLSGSITGTPAPESTGNRV